VLLEAMWSRELGVGNGSVPPFSLSMKGWPGAEIVDVLAAFLVCSEGWRKSIAVPA
jgi:hypothetical protein